MSNAFKGLRNKKIRILRVYCILGKNILMPTLLGNIFKTRNSYEENEKIIQHSLR